jgi:hypothetical protein
MGIDPNRVEELFLTGLGNGGGDEIEGIIATYLMKFDKVDAHRGEIISMLEQLPDEFMDNGGGGWSFLNLCTDKTGALWTGMQPTAEKLYVLAATLGLASFLMPRDLWSALPGGVPYIVFKRSKF